MRFHLQPTKRLITLSRHDPEFSQYLLGTFSSQYRALPIRSLNVDTERERVTFSISPLSDLDIPSFFVRWLEILRFHEWSFLIAPVSMIFLKAKSDGLNPSWIAGGCSLIGALCLFFSLILRNDFYDYTKGLDRLELSKSARAIQKGWITAAEGMRWSYVFIFAGLIFGWPALMRSPEILAVAGPFVALGVIEYSSQRLGLKYRGFGELIGFWLLGPALSVGFGMAIHQGFAIEDFWIGGIFGWMALLVLQFKNFEKILVHSQAKIRNLTTLFGFERTKLFLYGWLLLCLIWPALFNFWQKKYLTLWALIACQMGMTCLILQKLRRLQSCIGSELKDLTQMSHVFYNLSALTWVVSWWLESIL